MPRILKIKTAIIQANFQWTYVRVYSEDGYGTGECFFAPGLAAMVAELGELLIGEDPRNIEHLVETMRWAGAGAGSLGGLLWNAITGIEAALWDLKGKHYNMPVWQLLGGKFRDEVRLYLDCHAAGALESLNTLLQPCTPAWSRELHSVELTPEETIRASAERAAQMAQLGYTALKFDLDLPGTHFSSSVGYSIKSSDLDWMVRLAHEIRQAVGFDIDLAFDAHWRYRPNDILQVAKALEPCRLMWLEDPVPPHDETSLRYLRNHTATPIGTGENLQLREGFRRLIANDLCDIVTPDLQKAGGLAEGRKIADMAYTANKAFAPHMIGSPLALMATAHLSLTIPNFTVCEFHAHDVPFFHDLVQGGTTSFFRPGFITPSDKPGFGIELEEKTAKQYRLQGTVWFDDSGSNL